MESLYRKYRPQTFSDVVGQRHVVSTLENAVLEGKTSHAYLFCGPRGTGKTTMARLLAKALMCESGPGQLPDGTCEQCQLIAAGEHPDVIELDAASRTGVDDVRDQIISRVGYAPVMGRYKVYIIDEVHMLSPAAFNALLKTLEEPPSHVVFIMCTTDPQKILATILSRVQRFDFHPIAPDEMQQRLAYVCEQEGFTYDTAALDLVVRHARGGMRDALSTLEQLSVFGNGTISAEAARDLLGEASSASLEGCSKAIAGRDIATLFDEVATLVEAGRDLLQFTRELTAHLRDVYVVCAVGAKPGVTDAPEGELAALREEARAFGSPDRVAHALEALCDASNEMRTAPNQRLVLEVALTKVARPQADLTLAALADRVATLEAQVAALEAGVPAAAAQAMPAVPQGERHAALEVPPQAVPQAPQGERSMSAHQVAPAPAAQQAAPAPAAQPSHPQQKAPRRTAPAPQPRSQVAPASRPEQAAPRPMAQPAPQQAAPAQAAPGQAAQPRRQELQPAQPARSQGPAAPRPAPQPASQQRRQTAAPQPAPAPAPQVRPAAASNPGDLQRRWRAVIDELLANDPPRAALLTQTVPVSDDGTTLVVNLPKDSTFASRMLERPEVRAIIGNVVEGQFGHRDLSFVESSLAGADIARADRARAASRPARPAAPAPQPAQQPAARPIQQQATRPAQPPRQPQAAPRPAQQGPAASRGGWQQANAQAPQQRPAVPTGHQAPAPQQRPATPPPQAAPAPAPQPTPVPDLPWDDDMVPYDDLSAFSYDETEQEDMEFAPLASSAQPAPQVAPTPAPVSQQAPAPQAASAPTPQQAPAPQPTPAPASRPAQAPAPVPRPQATPQLAGPQAETTAPAPAPTPAPAPPAPGPQAPAEPDAPKPADSPTKPVSAPLPADLDPDFQRIVQQLSEAFGQAPKVMEVRPAGAERGTSTE